MTITISDSLEGLTEASIADGFFEEWPDPPSKRTHLELLRGSRAVALARDDSGQVVGFASATGDGVLTAYISLLEVVGPHRGKGIGSSLVQHLLDTLAPCYMVDVACDDDVAPFYERLGFTRATAMVRRDYAVQSGRCALEP